MSAERPSRPPATTHPGHRRDTATRQPPSVHTAAGTGGGLRRSNPIRQTAAAAIFGYNNTPAGEKVLFGATTSFAVTVAVSRTLNYVRERCRPMPRTRNFGRILAQVPGNDSIRVHHYLPGIGIGFATAATALLVHSGTLERFLSLPYGAGLALTTDELRILVGRNNPYWGGEPFALAQCAIATLASLGIATDILRRGYRIGQNGLAR